MKIIGLCGGSGSGKNEVCEYFSSLGIGSLDTDIVSRNMVQKGSECFLELTNFFSDSIIEKNGELNRKKLSNIVFADKSKLNLLNSITHKYILAECKKYINEEKNLGKKYTIINAPLLFESGFNKQCDIIISVIADFDLRVQRIKIRDNISDESAKRRIYTQRGREFLILNSDFVIFNNASKDSLKGTVNDIYKKMEKIYLLENTEDIR